MTVWVLHQQLTPQQEADIRQSPEVRLPFDALPDLSMVSGENDLKRLLQSLYPEDPPETLTRRVDKYWKIFSELHPEDVLAVPLSSRKEALVAEVTGPYRYYMDSDNSDVHVVPVKWHERTIPRHGLMKLKELFEYSGERMFEVTNKEARTVIRDCLPYKYNRFVKMKWVLAAFFVWFAARSVWGMFHQ